MTNHETARQALEQRELWPVLAVIVGGALLGGSAHLALFWRGRRWTWELVGIPLTGTLILVDPWLALGCGFATAVAILFESLAWVPRRCEGDSLMREVCLIGRRGRSLPHRVLPQHSAELIR